jgi:hypothetical protein
VIIGSPVMGRIAELSGQYALTCVSCCIFKQLDVTHLQLALGTLYDVVQSVISHCRYSRGDGSGVNDNGNLVSKESTVSTFRNEWHQCDEASDGLNDEAIACR